MERVIEHFLSLCAIPHKTHHEEAISLYLYNWGLERGLTAHRDEVGNVILEAPASPGSENAPTVILQAHMDMVCVAEDGRSYDPLTDPIAVINDGKTLTADGTSLGGDDGAGVAMAMAILEDKTAVHGPLRAIFTVDEEDGMLGAEALDPRFLEGKYLINLDWEGFGSLCCSSAGSDMYALRRPNRWEKVRRGFSFSIRLQGLEGGHSGAQIHLGRANAIQALAELLFRARNALVPIRLASFRGGSAHNAIPSSAEAVIVLPDDGDLDPRLQTIMDLSAKMLSDIRRTDPNAVFRFEKGPAVKKALSEEESLRFYGLLRSLRNGVNTMSPSIPGLVESSSNVGIASLDEDRAELVIHQRSSEPAAMKELGDFLRRQAEGFEFELTMLSSSPAWPVRPGSRLVEICEEHFRSLFGKDIVVEPVHAGLECGSFAQKNPALDIISIGPDILDIHSPKETLVLQSVYDCDKLVRNMLKEIAGE